MRKADHETVGRRIAGASSDEEGGRSFTAAMAHHVLVLFHPSAWLIGCGLTRA
jgi:hypothetical protein